MAGKLILLVISSKYEQIVSMFRKITSNVYLICFSCNNTSIKTRPLRVRFSEMHEKHPESSDTMETMPLTPQFYFNFSPSIQIS